MRAKNVLTFVTLGALGTFGCHTNPVPAPVIPPVTAQGTPIPAGLDYTQRLLTDAPVAGKRFKKRLAVARFRDNMPVDASLFGEKQQIDIVAPGMHIRQEQILSERNFVPVDFTERLIESLGATERFILVERKDINQVLRELSFDESKWVDQNKSAKVGKVLGAQVIVTGALLPNDDPSTRDLGSMVLLLRLYDVETSRIVGTTRAVGKSQQEVIDRAVAQIVSTMEQTPWTGRIASVARESVYLNAGSLEGIQSGDRFELFALGKMIKDPTSGEAIGYEEQLAGLGEVVSVSERTAKMKLLQMEKPVKVGDKVQLVGH